MQIYGLFNHLQFFSFGSCCFDIVAIKYNVPLSFNVL